MTEPQQLDLMEGDDVTTHGTLEAVQRMGQAAGAQLAWTIVKVFVGAFVSITIAMGAGYARDTRDNIKDLNAKLDAQAVVIEGQDKSSGLLEQRVRGLEKITDATVLALQNLSGQVDHNTIDVSYLKEQKVSAVERTRPGS